MNRFKIEKEKYSAVFNSAVADTIRRNKNPAEITRYTVLWKSYVFDFMRLTMEKLHLWFHETYYGKATSLISWDLLWKSYVFDFMRLTMEKLRLWFHETYYGKATSLISCEWQVLMRSAPWLGLVLLHLSALNSAKLKRYICDLAVPTKNCKKNM